MRRRGNPNWGKPIPPTLMSAPVQLTEFERLCVHLKLTTEADMLRSEALRKWVCKHAKHRYIPESYLQALGISVDVLVGDVL